ncbi:hypothetical protein [Paenibacillus polymyxa]|uniref:Uncharacterized protein n=1 Tax=Paenibacillus polymyxa (strain SC2) TaxID=886882 RepID=E3EKK8_PAEPS|nr:hypothetical protein [Paenibacillus polymyxa]ADO59840.1 hypothetical protein PPSC2_25970 [Paenibacillus polymyxa SC2]WPQ59928.1 hypothetical protein SKN87_27180 [Paenibacillus polymyxa]
MEYTLTQKQKKLIDEIVNDPMGGKNWFINCHKQGPYLWDDEILHDIPIEAIYDYFREEMTVEEKLQVAYDQFGIYVTDTYIGREKDFQAGMRAACKILGVSIGKA